MFQYKVVPTNRESLYMAYSNMKSSSTNESFYTIKTYKDNVEMDTIHLHEGLVTSKASNDRLDKFSLANVTLHPSCTDGKAEASTADELKESVDK